MDLTQSTKIPYLTQLVHSTNDLVSTDLSDSSDGALITVERTAPTVSMVLYVRVGTRAEPEVEDTVGVA